MEWIGFGFDLDLTWIEIGVFKNFKECARSPCNGNHFSSLIENLRPYTNNHTLDNSLSSLLLVWIGSIVVTSNFIQK